jgi:hypothetical protein
MKAFDATDKLTIARAQRSSVQAQALARHAESSLSSTSSLSPAALDEMHAQGNSLRAIAAEMQSSENEKSLTTRRAALCGKHSRSRFRIRCVTTRDCALSLGGSITLAVGFGAGGSQQCAVYEECRRAQLRKGRDCPSRRGCGRAPDGRGLGGRPGGGHGGTLDADKIGRHYLEGRRTLPRLWKRGARVPTAAGRCSHPLEIERDL